MDPQNNNQPNPNQLPPNSAPSSATPVQPQPGGVPPQQPVQSVPTPAQNYAQGQVDQAYAQTPIPPQQPTPVVLNAQRDVNPNSTQNSLLIAEIRDGIVIMNDGSFRSVLMAKSINFDLMSPEEREAVEYAYQGFLNSLYFPVQIFIRSEKVDLKPYVEKLDKMRSEQENMLLALMMEDYIEFISILAEETNIMDKQFYIVVPFYLQANTQRAMDEGKKLFDNLTGKNSKPKGQEQTVIINEADLLKAKDELKNRVQSVMSGLLQLNVHAVPLDTRELGTLYYNMYNPDTATRQHFDDISSINAPVVTKGQGLASQPNLDREIR